VKSQPHHSGITAKPQWKRSQTTVETQPNHSGNTAKSQPNHSEITVTPEISRAASCNSLRCRRTVSCNSLRCHRPGALLQRFQPAPHVRNGPRAVHVSGEQQRWRVSGSSAPAQSSLQPVNAAQAESARGYGVFLGGSAAARPPLAMFERAERPFRKFGLRSAGCSHTWNSSGTPHDLVQTGAASLSLHNAPTPLPCPPPSAILSSWSHLGSE